MRKRGKYGVIESKFRIRVDYRVGFRAMVTSAQQHAVDENITEEHFPLLTNRGFVHLNIVLVYFEDPVRTEEMVQSFLATPPREPAHIEHILALARDVPEIQRNFSVPALGSRWERRFRERRFIAARPDHVDVLTPVLTTHRGQRVLEVVRIGEYGGDVKFAAVEPA